MGAVEAGDRVEGQLGPGRDHQVVIGKRVAADPHDALAEVDPARLTDDQLDPRPQQRRHRACDLGRGSPSHHKPEEGSGERVDAAPLHNYDAVPARQQLTQPVCRHQTAHAASQDQDCSRIH